MTRHCLFLDLVDDAELIAEYRRWHEPGGPPAAVNRSIRDAGILEMEIWQVGNRLAMIMETAPGFDACAKASRDAADPEVQAWEKLMDRFHQRLACASSGEKWVVGERIYALSQQPS